MNDAALRLLLILVAAVTLFSGTAQLLAPHRILAFVAPEATPAEAHFFRTVGMFMLITGAMFLQSLLQRTDAPAIPLWIAVQKLLAAVLVFIGWQKGYFLWLALGVAAFDLASGVLAFLFWRRIGK